MQAVIATSTGKLLDVFNIAEDDITIEEIAHALSLICRYGGRCEKFYSVAEHCVVMSKAEFLPGRPLAKLLHDAAETYIGDIVTGLKNCLPEVVEVESHILETIGKKFGVSQEEFEAVKEADKTMLVTESFHIMSNSFETFQTVYPDNPPNPRIKLNCWSPEMAELMYIQTFNKIPKIPYL